MPTLIAIAVVEHENRFLVGERGPHVPLPGLYEFPGGKVEPGESPEEAAVRECLEETGLAVRVVDQYPAQVQTYDHVRVDLRFFRCVADLPDLSPRPPYRWAERAELATLEFPAGNATLLRLLCQAGERVDG